VPIARLPYNLAVQAALIVLKEHLHDLINVTNDEAGDSWRDARQLVAHSAGFGSEFKLDPTA
jgi:hypothetical protein